ncbi:hypothetical protein VF21_01439 [Pseudogymnoascus sp. 05NY08]|nr:hypothetical protein VF21_01439 [Pseudogymnoascus sp. 05NY08]
MPTKKTRLDDNTVRKMHLLQALNQVSKATIKSFDAFISDGTINPAFLGHDAPCLDSAGQAMLYRPRNTALGLIPLIGEASDTPIRQGKYIVNDLANLKEMPKFNEYVASIIQGSKWKYVKPAELGEVVLYKIATKRTAAQESDDDLEIDSITVQPGAKGRRTDGTDHSQLYLEIEKLSNKFDKRQEQDDMLNSVQKLANTVLEQNNALRKQNEGLREQNDALLKQNDALSDALSKQNAVLLERANPDVAPSHPRNENSNQIRLTRRRLTEGMAG